MAPKAQGRLGFAGLTVLLFFGAVGFLLSAILPGPPMIGDLKFNDLIASAVEAKLDLSRRSFDLTVLVLVGLWGMVIAKKDEVAILLSDWQEIIMFTCTNLLLLASVAAHIYYMNDILDIYALAGSLQDPNSPISIPDIFTSRLNDPFMLQFWFFIVGVFSALLTFVSAHWLK